MTWKRLASSLAAAVLVCGTAACADEPEFNGADTQTTTALLDVTSVSRTGGACPGQ